MMKSLNVMKGLKLTFAGMVLLISGALHAQVSVNVNIGSPPLWGPVGYTDVRYYYLPDVEAYYDVPSSVFIYYTGVSWVRRAYLPSRYSSYDLYYGYKVVLTDYYGTTPYKHFKEHKTKYAKGYRGPAQKSYGEKPGKGNQGNDGGVDHNGNGKNKSQGNGKSKKK